VAHFDIPLDLPHAGRLADRILNLLERHCEENGVEAVEAIDTAERISNLLFRYSANDENPGGAEAVSVRDEAAVLGRQLVDQLDSGQEGGESGEHDYEVYLARIDDIGYDASGHLTVSQEEANAPPEIRETIERFKLKVGW